MFLSASKSKPKWKPIREGFNFLEFIERGIDVDDLADRSSQRLRIPTHQPSAEEQEMEEQYDSAGDLNFDEVVGETGGVPEAMENQFRHDEF